MLEVTKLLINGGIDINALDKYKVIPLKYAITITKLPSNELKPIYEIYYKASLLQIHLVPQYISLRLLL